MKEQKGEFSHCSCFCCVTLGFLFRLPVVRIFMASNQVHSPVVMEGITLPCLKILHHLVRHAKTKVGLFSLSLSFSLCNSHLFFFTVTVCCLTHTMVLLFQAPTAAAISSGNFIHANTHGWLKRDKTCQFSSWRRHAFRSGNCFQHLPSLCPVQ